MRNVEPDYPKAKRYVVDLFHLEANFRSSFTAEEREYINTYVNLAEEHILKGTLYDQRRKKWSRFNFRYGHWSILGTLCEIAAIPIILNSNSLTARLCPDTKELQMKGHDLIISKPHWKETYPAQVKHLIRRNGHIGLRASYFNPKYTTDRLLLVEPNPSKMEALHVDYHDAKIWFFTHKREADRDGLLMVPVEDFRNLNHFHPFRL